MGTPGVVEDGIETDGARWEPLQQTEFFLDGGGEEESSACAAAAGSEGQSLQ